MTNYHGSPAVHAVLRELVAVLDIDDPLLRDVRIALGATGVMRGEFGHRDALISQQSGLDFTGWLTLVSRYGVLPRICARASTMHSQQRNAAQRPTSQCEDLHTVSR